MSGTPELGRAVLELATDSKQYFADMAKSEAGVKALRGVFTGFRSELEKSAGAAQGLGTSFAKLAGGVAAGTLLAHALETVAGAAVAAGKELFELVKRGDDVADVAAAFNGLAVAAGLKPQKALQALRTGTQGLISDFDLMQKTNVALRAGLRLTEQEFGQVGAASRVLAKSVGGETKDAYDALLSALTTGRAKGLTATYGVMANLKGASAELKDALTDEGLASTTAATAHAARGAIMAEVTRIVLNAGDAELDFGDRVTVAKVQVDNFRDALAQGIAEAPALKVVLVEIAKAMGEAFGYDRDAMVKNVALSVDKLALKGLQLVVNLVDVADFMQTWFAALQMGADAVVWAFAKIGYTILKVGDFAATTQKYLNPLAYLAGGGADRQRQLREEIDVFNGYLEGLGLHMKEVQERSDRWGNALQGLKPKVSALAEEIKKAEAGLGNARPTTPGVVSGTGGATTAPTAAEKQFDAALKSLRAFDVEVTRALDANLPFKDLLDSFGKKAVEASQQATIWGLSTSQAIDTVAVAYADNQMATVLSEIGADTKKLAIGWQKEFEKNQQGIAEALNKGLLDQVVANRKYHDEIGLMGKQGVALAIAQLDLEKKAEIAALGERTKLNARYWDDNLKLIEEKYAKRLKLLGGTWQQELSGLAASFRNLAQAAGAGGLGDVAQSLGNIVGAADLGVQAGTSLKDAFTAINGKTGSTTANMMKIAGATMQVAAAMEQATQSASHAQNAISGAATGAAFGAQVSGGNPYAIAAGAIIGGLYGYYKNTPQDDVTDQMKAQWADQYGGAAALKKQLEMSGTAWASIDDYNAAMNAGQDDLDQFNEAVKKVNYALKQYQETLNAYRAAAVGTQTIAEGLDATTTVAQFERLGVYAGAIFGKLLQETGSITEAFAAMGPTLDAIVKARDQYGFQTTGVMNEMLQLYDAMSGNTALSSRVSGLGQIGTALGANRSQLMVAMGITPTFGADLKEAYDQLRLQGLSQQQSLMLLQGPLQALYEGARGLGSGVTDNPEYQAAFEILNLARASGFVGENLRPTAEKQLDVLTQIRDLLAGVPVNIGGGDGPGDGSRPPTVPDEYTQVPWAGYVPWEPAPGTKGLLPAYPVEPYATYATGTDGFEYFGGGKLAMLHGWEAVIRPQDLTPMPASTGGRDIHTHVYLDRREIANAVARDLPQAVRRYGAR